MSQRNIFGEASVRPWYGPGSPEPTSRPQRGPGRDTPSRFNRAARPSSQDWKAPDIKSNPITSVDFVPKPSKPQSIQPPPPDLSKIPRFTGKTRQTTLRLNVPKTKGQKPERGPKVKKPKSPGRQLSFKLKESQLFLESYYRSLEKSK